MLHVQKGYESETLYQNMEDFLKHTHYYETKPKD
jgi:hypothetical protein